MLLNWTAQALWCAEWSFRTHIYVTEMQLTRIPIGVRYAMQVQSIDVWIAIASSSSPGIAICNKIAEIISQMA